jgi:hypothetical protein
MFYLFLYNAYHYVLYLPGHPELSDFRAFYAAGRVGLASGWGAIYDRGHLEPTIHAIWPGSAYAAFANPPPLAWLFVPVSLLPPKAAFFGWAALQVVILSACALICAPRRPLPRVAAVLSALALLPTYTIVTYGMVTPLVLLGLVGCWALLRQGSPVAAGAALVLIVLKPQGAFLVPPALLAAGYLRSVAAWAVGAAILAVASLAAIGPDGAAAWLQAMHVMTVDSFYLRYSIADLAGGGWAGWAARGAVVAAALVAAWLARGRGPEVPLAAGVAASLLLSPHTTPGDFVLLLLPVWLLLRTAPPIEVVLFMGTLWFVAWLAPGPALPVVLGELALIGVLVGYGLEGRRWGRTESESSEAEPPRFNGSHLQEAARL